MRSLATAVVAAAFVVTALGPSVDGQTISANPRLYREWMRRETDKDLALLYRSTSEIVRLLDEGSPVSQRELRKHADEIVKRAHDAWSNVQLRHATRERPKGDPTWKPRDRTAARDDAAMAQALVREIAMGISSEQRTREVNAALRISTLDTLERVERIGLRLRVDLAPPAKD